MPSTAAGSSTPRTSACAAAPCGTLPPGAAAPEKTLAMWDRVLDGETRYIKGFKTTADFLLDTSFTYELGLISRLLGIVRRQFTLEATTPNSGTRLPAALSTWSRWIWSFCPPTACCGSSTAVP